VRDLQLSMASFVAMESMLTRHQYRSGDRPA
jgi:hypothetical protein